MAKRRKGWTWMPAKPSSVPPSVKADVSARAQALVDSHLKPEHVKKPPNNPQFNYVVDILTKWHGRYFYFMSKYASPGRNALSQFFESGFARLEYQRDGRFSLAYHRHTGQWWLIYEDLTIDEALKSIRDDPFFQP